MKVELCINVYYGGGSNMSFEKDVSRNYKYLNNGDIFAIENDDFTISKKRYHDQSDILFVISDYDVEENQDSIDNIKNRLLDKGFIEVK